MNRICLGAFLFMQALLDASTGYVSVPLLLVQAAVGIGMNWGELQSGQIWVVCFFPGIVLLAFSVLSRERIGQGDGWLFLVLGLYLSAVQQAILLLCALFLASMWIIPSFLMHRVDKENGLPFVPFVLAAYVGGCIYGWF